MRVVILEKPQEIIVTTVTLVNDPFNPSAWNMMHCMKCGRYLIQYCGNIVRITPGAPPQNILEISPKLIVKCHDCKSKYLINNVI